MSAEQAGRLTGAIAHEIERYAKAVTLRTSGESST
jgi:hypothetical protein